MQPDQELYNEMLRRGSRGRWFWRAGVWLNYVGIVGIISLFCLWPVVFFLKPGGWGILFSLSLVALAGLYTLGTLLKRISYRIALREGIDITKFIS